MIVNLRESKARLSELVELASRGEDVLITVRGRIRARLVGVPAERGILDAAGWVRDLEALHRSCTIASRQAAEALVEEDRRERDL